MLLLLLVCPEHNEDLFLLNLRLAASAILARMLSMRAASLASWADAMASARRARSRSPRSPGRHGGDEGGEREAGREDVEGRHESRPGDGDQGRDQGGDEGDGGKAERGGGGGGGGGGGADESRGGSESRRGGSAAPRNPEAEGCKLYIGNLSFQTQGEDIREHFSQVRPCAIAATAAAHMHLGASAEF